MPDLLTPSYWTAEMVRALPEDGQIYEVVHGELLVTPAPRPWHEEVGIRLLESVRAYLRAEPVGHAYGSRSDLSWGLRDVLVSPDLFVVPLEEARRLDWLTLRTVLLAAEVLSPSSIRADRFTKRRLYQERGVPLYWVIDPEARVAEIWRPQDELPTLERQALVWEPAGARAPFTLALAELFRPL
jgi:Uma2 family endonuclease